ncbi:MAG: metallophosphoesterase [Bacteroidetes bacterium]|nr:metallophosphoesterase [Bacteroidota bacterium]
MFKGPVLGFLFFSAIFLAIDFYTWQGVKFLTQNWSLRSRSILKYIYWGYTVANFLFFLLWRMDVLHMSPAAMRIVSAISFVIFFGKLFWCIFLVIDDVGRVFRWVYSRLFAPQTAADTAVAGISRLKFLNWLGLGVGAAFVGTAIHGIASGAHNYTIRRRDLRIKGLPAGFEGATIVQISDVHSGSFWDTKAVNRGIDMIMAEKPDMVFFTGDLVNDRAEEFEPWKEVFGRIQAPLGVYSVLGNHDYGDYVPWPSHEAKHKNLQDLIAHHRDIGWDILLDEHRIVERNGDKMPVLGVQNWSAKARFPRYGNLEKAHAGTESFPVKLLLSHDPSHWKEEVLPKYPGIAATFSGHTHGMQFGIDTRFYRWSPVKMLYKEWLDLYTEGHQHLYVNRGFGYIGYPGRMGVLPEISVFTLKQA